MQHARLFSVLTALLVGSSLLATGCATSPLTAGAPASADPVVATFAGETLTLDEFETRYALASGGREAAAEDDLAAYQDYLTRYVDFRLKVQQARDLGLADDPEILREINDYRDQLAKPYLLERTVLEDIVRDLYEKQKEEIHAAHILLNVAENAAPEDTLRAYTRLTAIRDSILAGADFAAMAVRHSEDPSAARNQGDLSYFTGGRMIEAFEEQAYATPVGGVSPVFRTSFGYHILRVADRRAAVPEIRASHILVRLADGASAADSAEARALVESLRERVLAGEDFATLARQYSDDEVSGQRGGDLDFFSRARMVEPFSNAAYALDEIGDVSGVVETPFGYHLIQLTDRKAPRTYEEAYPELKQLAERLPRTAVRRQAVGRAFRAEVGSTLDAAAIARATAAYPADTLLRRAVLGRFDAYGDSTFAAIGDSTFVLRDLADHIRTVRLTVAPDQHAQLLDLADGYLDEKAVELAAYRLEETDPQFRRIMQDYEDGVLLFRISEDSIWSAAARDSLGLLRHFEAHAEDYRFPERRRVVGFYSRNDSLLQAVVSGLDEGLTPAALQARLADADPGVQIDTVYVSAEGGTIFDRAFALNAGQRTPILPYQSRQAVLYLDGVEAPRPMTFEEARAQALADYQDVLDARFRARLRETYDARLYPERLQAAFQDPAPADETTASAQ